MKPDWKDAPEWARWLAMDADGTWYWYEFEPERYAIFWDCLEGRREEAEKDHWKETLRSRPTSRKKGFLALFPCRPTMGGLVVMEASHVYAKREHVMRDCPYAADGQIVEIEWSSP